MSNSTIVLRPLPLMSSLFHIDGIKSLINEFTGNEVMNMFKRNMKALLFRKDFFWRIYVDYLTTLKRDYDGAWNKKRLLVMLQRHLKTETRYNIPGFEKAWKELKDTISIGIYFNAFCKKEALQEIWDISEIRREERVRVIENNTVTIQNTPRRANVNYKRRRFNRR